MVSKQKNTVLIMAGGTGGHIFPALAVAEDLRENQVDIVWLGTKDGLEADLIPKHDIPLYFLSVTALRGRNVFGQFVSIFKLIWAFFQALIIIIKVKPRCVLGMGGYVSAPGAMAAYVLRKPIIIHEQNAVLGMTNRWIAKIAQHRFEGFPQVFEQKKNTTYVGNPVRRDIVHMLKPKLRYSQRKGRLHLLVLGGSRGATWINDAIPQVLTTLSPKDWPEIWHQTGQKDMTKVQHAYQKLSICAKVEPFIDDMAKAYAWADLVISRSGALTVCELMAAGVAAILIPYPHAVDDHQTRNALFLQQIGAAFVLQQSAEATEKLTELMTVGMKQQEKLLVMAELGRNAAKIDATEQIVAHCLELCHG